jgi:REP element-mobilizing transposase RayT
LRSNLRSLRSQFVFPTLRLTFASMREREGSFRVVHFSVQGNHIHMLVEASSRAALSSGLRSLAIRIALRVNRLLMRRGRVWADRYHQRALVTPRAVRNALVYVLGNFRKHGARSVAAIDACSTAPYFDGFHDRARAGPQGSSDGQVLIASSAEPASAPRTWLLATGWKRHGLLGSGESPVK